MTRVFGFAIQRVDVIVVAIELLHRTKAYLLHATESQGLQCLPNREQSLWGCWERGFVDHVPNILQDEQRCAKLDVPLCVGDENLVRHPLVALTPARFAVVSARQARDFDICRRSRPSRPETTVSVVGVAESV